MNKEIKFKLIAMDKESIDYIDVEPKNKDEIGHTWIESDAMEYDQAQKELREIYENKLIRVELLRWQKQLLNTKAEGTNMGRFLSDEIESRFFAILKPNKETKVIEPKEKIT